MYKVLNKKISLKNTIIVVLTVFILPVAGFLGFKFITRYHYPFKRGTNSATYFVSFSGLDGGNCSYGAYKDLRITKFQKGFTHNGRTFYAYFDEMLSDYTFCMDDKDLAIVKQAVTQKSESGFYKVEMEVTENTLVEPGFWNFLNQEKYEYTDHDISKIISIEPIDPDVLIKECSNPDNCVVKL